MANRKDAKGRVLKAGESQRKDGTYMYRYTNIRGKRQSIYAPDLKKLREKEQEIQKDANNGIDYAAGNITVIELVKRYVGMKKGIRKSTTELYKSYTNTISKFDFAERNIRDIKMSDAKQFVIELYDSGKKANTIRSILNVIIPAFAMACNEDVIRKNPFSFSIFDVVPNEHHEKKPLTPQQQKDLLDFMKTTSPWYKYYDIVNVLLGTGLRISEFCGLTIDDIDFENRRIFINKQLVYTPSCETFIEKPKTNHGVRYVPITDQIFQSLKDLVKRSQDNNKINIIDGYHGFIALKLNGNVLNHSDLGDVFRRLKLAYNKKHPLNQIEELTPHILRHTFCTNMATAGIDVKSLQYLMGHSNVNITFNIYAHASYENAASQVFAITGKNPLFKAM